MLETFNTLFQTALYSGVADKINALIEMKPYCIIQGGMCLKATVLYSGVSSIEVPRNPIELLEPLLMLKPTDNNIRGSGLPRPLNKT